MSQYGHKRSDAIGRKKKDIEEKQYPMSDDRQL